MVRREHVMALLKELPKMNFDKDVHPNDLDVDFVDFGNERIAYLNTRGIKHLYQLNSSLFPFEDKNVLDKAGDVEPEKYLGGFKVWEGTVDLLNYLHDNKFLCKNFRVADFGCGAGILGIFALRQQAKTVHFLDFNREVLDWFTLPNVAINLGGVAKTFHELVHYAFKKSIFVDSDWYIANYLINSKQRFDLILASEILFDKAKYDPLLKIFDQRLNPLGQILIATKIYYFGNNTGLEDFKNAVTEQKKFDLDEVKTINDTVVRKIIRLRRKEHIGDFAEAWITMSMNNEKVSDHEEEEFHEEDVPNFNLLNFKKPNGQLDEEAYVRFFSNKPDIDVDLYYKNLNKNKKKD